MHGHDENGSMDKPDLKQWTVDLLDSDSENLAWMRVKRFGKGGL
jgi:hypothetical protein